VSGRPSAGVTGPTAPVTLGGLHHVALCVHDLDRALAFYTTVLGLEQVHRPPLGQPGAWLTVGGHPDQMVHLMVTGEDPAATFQHFALTCPDLGAAADVLAACGYELSAPQVVEGYGRQAFVRDPEGNLVELNEPLRAGG
jgi:catechol 2,3-dioxygenase-like lactoylglutathione lyase family enzyme